MVPRVESLFIYPLKAARGIALHEMPVVASGPQFDREWMLVNDKGLFISQRTHPQMSQLTTVLTNNHLIVQDKQSEPLRISLARTMGKKRNVRIFQNETQAEELGEPYDHWFSAFLGESVHLVRSPQGKTRETSGRSGPKTEILFQDGYPFLLTNDATLDVLNKQLTSPIGMDRFRPNIVVSGVPADQEDQWEMLQIDDVPFLSVKACTRCAVIDVDPATGQKDKNVTRTLKTYRTQEGHVVFGRNLSHLGLGKIRVGSEVLVKK